MRHIGDGVTASAALTKTVTAVIFLFGGQSIVRLGATLAIFGGVVSRTVTVNTPTAVLPWASVDEHLTLVVPRAKIAPLAGEQVTTSAPSTISAAVAAKVTRA